MPGWWRCAARRPSGSKALRWRVDEHDGEVIYNGWWVGNKWRVIDSK